MSYGITLDEIELSSREYLAKRIKAEQHRERRMLEYLRWAVAAIMAPHLKKPIKPENLLPFPDEKRIKKREVEKLTQDDDEDAINKMMMAAWEKEFGKNKKDA